VRVTGGQAARIYPQLGALAVDERWEFDLVANCLLGAVISGRRLWVDRDGSVVLDSIHVVAEHASGARQRKPRSGPLIVQWGQSGELGQVVGRLYREA
jgi:hypothetical protein